MSTELAATITESIRERLLTIVQEQNDLIKERAEVVRAVWVARIANQHVLFVGPGGTGKSLHARDVAAHIAGSRHFEVVLDETSDPSEVFGPPDIKAMAEEGITSRSGDGYLQTATDAFIDEFFNANGPVLHSSMAALNERLLHERGVAMSIPLRQCLMGTNKLNVDVDQAALWDRIHHRYEVGYIKSRENQIAMVIESVARLSLSGRGASTDTGTAKTQVTLEELDQAREEALNLYVPDNVLNALADLRQELAEGDAKVEISDRRFNEGMVAVMANAWLRGHETVQIADLDILSGMWWTLLEQRTAAAKIILAQTNPNEKAALDLLDGLMDLRREYEQADDEHKKKVAIQQTGNTDRLLREARTLKEQNVANGTSTERIDEVIQRGLSFKAEMGKVFGLDPASMAGV
jgi:MoxR-like ATPase